MCVVGYDDNKYGGAFEIQNSWGTRWGNDGYIWISYRDFVAFIVQAFEILENLANYKNAVKYAASIKIEVYNNNNGMLVTYDRQVFIKPARLFYQGTDFRFLMTNRHPTYVYAFAADTSSTNSKPFFGLLLAISHHVR
jgi:hypothetical protein